MSTYMVDGKKMMNICILEILRKYTDSEHTMDQKDIIKKLETEYGMKVDPEIRQEQSDESGGFWL